MDKIRVARAKMRMRNAVNAYNTFIAEFGQVVEEGCGFAKSELDACRKRIDKISKVANRVMKLKEV